MKNTLALKWLVTKTCYAFQTPSLILFRAKTTKTICENEETPCLTSCVLRNQKLKWFPKQTTRWKNNWDTLIITCVSYLQASFKKSKCHVERKFIVKGDDKWVCAFLLNKLLRINENLRKARRRGCKHKPRRDIHCDLFMFLFHFQDKMLLSNKQPNLKHFFVSNEIGQILFVQT